MFLQSFVLPSLRLQFCVRDQNHTCGYHTFQLLTDLKASNHGGWYSLSGGISIPWEFNKRYTEHANLSVSNWKWWLSKDRFPCSSWQDRWFQTLNLHLHRHIRHRWVEGCSPEWCDVEFAFLSKHALRQLYLRSYAVS